MGVIKKICLLTYQSTHAENRKENTIDHIQMTQSCLCNLQIICISKIFLFNKQKTVICEQNSRKCDKISDSVKLFEHGIASSLKECKVHCLSLTLSDSN